MKIAAPSPQPDPAHGHSTPALTLAALGVVFGDIGTSPLYTLSECFHAKHGAATTPLIVLGVLSLIFWSLVVVIAFKYLAMILRADNGGEGGIFALLALMPERLLPNAQGRLRWTTLLALIGAALLFGDGIITPAISVLSAMEGLEVVAPAYHWAVLPATCAVLLGLFAMQSRGTGAIGVVFGPIMVVWFVTLAALGINQISQNPSVLWALNPIYAIRFFASEGPTGFLILGAVVLAITGGEALYADLGHFGRRPIRIAWFAVAMPALVLNYFGQGALVLAHPGSSGSPFYSLVPAGPWTYALIALATAATVIASQALISGAFSLTHQAVRLGFFPTVRVTHTSRHSEGQIYIPAVNWMLAAACTALVLMFKRSSNLAAAYGLAVTGTMAITTIIYFEVVRTRWQWPLWKALPPVLLFLIFDVAYFIAASFKFVDGGYIPVIIAVGFFIVMWTWKRGWDIYREHVKETVPKLDRLFTEGAGKGVARTPGTGVFPTGVQGGVPPVLSNLITRIGVLPAEVVLLHMTTAREPYVSLREQKPQLEALGDGLYRLSVCIGFMDRPSVPVVLAEAVAASGHSIDVENVTYYVGRYTFVASAAGKMGRRAEWLFALLTRNAQPLPDHLDIPWRQVVEIGAQIDL
ncbi:MAG: KUP/HAK/KT family potassium transporter [Deltaproteobacteria bacterium]|nr:KUP/HAK/KT family potassium transporter [Deltaproteobacteria bacterium]